MTDTSGTITFVNDAFERVYGYQAAEVIGRVTPRILKGGFTTQAEYERFWQGLLRGEIFRGEFVNRTKGGALLHMEVSVTPIRAGQDGFAGFLAVQRDVTARKEMDAALRMSEERYRTLAEAARDGIVILARDGRYEYLNTAAARPLGRTPEAIVGRHFSEMFPTEVAAAMDRRLRQVWETSAPVYSELRVVFPSGDSWQAAWLAPVLDQSGRMRSVMVISRDITERHRLAELLERQNALLNAIVESSPVGIAVLHGPTFVCELVNPALQRMAPGRALAGAPFADVCPEHAGTITRMLARVTETGVGEEMVDVGIDVPAAAGGSPARRSVSVLASPLRKPGPAARDGVLAVVTDTTQRQQLEAQFVQAQKMEAVGRLAGGIAHDFNNLLTSITGYAELVAETLDPQDPRRHDIEEIQRAGHSATSLTRQLLTFSRKHVFNPRVLDVNAVIAHLEQIVRRTIGEDVEVALHLDPDPGWARVDQAQLEQIVMNLTVNARDAMAEGGVLTLATANRVLDASEPALPQRVPPGSYVVLSVADTGVGMSAEVQSHLFEPFFTTKAPGKGSGLGLSTVYGIVEQSGGHLAVSSAPGRGTTVTIFLPQVQEPSERQSPDAPIGPAPGGTETVLIAEDDEALRQWARRALEASGYTTIVSANAEEASRLADATSGPIHLLLTDVVMPGANGLALFRALSRKRPDLRVLYMSGHTDEVISHHGLLDRGVQFLQKPFRRDRLARTVRAVLDAPQPADPNA